MTQKIVVPKMGSEEKDEIIRRFHTPKIQTSFNVISKIFDSLVPFGEKKFLVFGLGYDSKLWYEGNKRNTYFVEDKREYIDLNKEVIDPKKIIHYSYGDITVEKSFNLDDQILDQKYPLPAELKDLAPFDLIFIDGPRGYSPKRTPGRLLPIYWAKKYLSKKGTVVFVDDTNRPLESHCVQKYFSNDRKEEFKEERLGCTVIYL